MQKKSRSNSVRVTRRTFAAGAGAAAFVAGAAPFNIVRAQGGPLKVGVILPRTGYEAGIGQDCQRGVDIAPAIFKSLGLPELTIINGDTESNVDTARARAEKLIGDGAQALVGSFDSGQTAAIAQVAEQKGHSARHQHRGGARHHRAGLQVRVPEFSDRADDPARCLHRSEGCFFPDGLGAKDRCLHARQRYVRHGDGQRHRRRHAEVQHALHDRRRDCL